jgi:hypothetical protein
MKTWLNVAEAAGYAGVGRDTIYTVCERGDVPYAPLRGRRAIHQRGWIVGSREQHIRGGRTDANTRPRPSALAQFADGRTERTMALSAGTAVTGASHLSMCRPRRECYDGC